ncbi:TPA: 50S ribosomal protein L33 [Patescibacteria group bacterium]|uniref:Large ribosomal subunit protein bL33 n=1 Tax=Candidatus Terrybacteria bacterium CG10_big_fil_rev_8_21_14_0_10_41_10 TaxID=1975026 RepID=A0A2M8LAP2_9BACT|nr:MAG: 50S ribosomal protein L33 [Parcubacteria group bacterium GW2011_GWF2_40_10]KKR47124.1 MAG: 50S ribosomal protein L33 [Parcubacteria group bacterium GW2011_GWA2_40_143]KKR59731.1 MAG: 50S ribosomal protein L33 [Parcubacteria group bacterium GW2011_GWC2_40_31]KKR81715.1 MAG: 50S ribosomal protein L33 [Parcubacteria group bacterium GW2011_GWD2_40_9]PJE73689.1 MAG: 50S ribosomal protein L33 [Candidatus Terrybacteria bacterium CG10_big_fil_rev_8_21_14_0_10_41_10]HCI04431.1 50S ribosomal pro
MSQDNLLKLKCSSCNRINYWTRKNKRKAEYKVNTKKHCKWCKKHTEHKEMKK